MNMGASERQGWLSNSSVRRAISEQLQATGRLMLQEIRARRFPPGFARIITQTLRAPGKLLGSPVSQGALVDPSDRWLWPMVSLLVAAAASGTPTALLATLPSAFWQQARIIAAASEFLGAALDLLDDIQDSDSPFVQQIGVPLALNTGVALLELPPLVIGKTRSSASGWSDAMTHAALEVIHSSILNALIGQFMDLRLERSKKVTEAQALEMTGQKSGSLVALVCRLGALAGAAGHQERPAEYFDSISRFGWHLGVWAQLFNDLHDAEGEQNRPGKSDRQRGKKTLPLVLEEHDRIEGARAPAEQWQAASYYTAVAGETFRFRAQKELQLLEERFGPHSLLWSLVERA
jgi:geranylgeranyl pyrophosphate synthase